MDLEVGKIYMRKDGRYEGRYRINGKTYTTAYSRDYEDCIAKHNDRVKLMLSRVTDESEKEELVTAEPPKEQNNVFEYLDQWFKKNMQDYIATCVNQQVGHLKESTPTKAFIPTKTITLYEYLDNWLITYKKGIIADRSFTQLEICVRKHTKPNIENLPISDITPSMITELLKRISSSRMREYTYNTLFEAFKQARIEQLIPLNPCEGAKFKKHVREKGMSLTKYQQEEFLDVIKSSRLRYQYLFYLYSGCRPAEGLEVKWSDVDYNNNRLLIRGTKTECSRRYIPLFEPLKEIIEKLPRKTEYVFGISLTTIKKDLEIIKSKVSFPITLKTLRHTFCTRCYESGIPEKTIAQWMGHSAKSSITSRVYIDSLPEYEQKLSQTLFQNDTI